MVGMHEEVSTCDKSKLRSRSNEKAMAIENSRAHHKRSKNGQHCALTKSDACIKLLQPDEGVTVET